MPSFLITSSQQYRAGKTVNAQLFAPGPTGHPNERTAVPVRATISEKAIRIDDGPRPRAIISARSENGATTYLVNGSTQQVRERRAALAKALAQLQQLTASLRPLQAQSEEPELAFEGLGLLFNWISDERERLEEGSHHG